MPTSQLYIVYVVISFLKRGMRDFSRVMDLLSSYSYFKGRRGYLEIMKVEVDT